MELTRRSFVAAAATVGAGIVAGSAITTAIAEEMPMHEPVSVEECDIVIVGTGTSGMCCATRAAELGAKVILLEKRPAIGGTSGFAEGIGGINSYMHKEQGLEFDCNEALQRTQDYHHWAADSAVLSRFIKESGATIDWLHESCGIDFAVTTVVSPTSYPSWHLGNNPEGMLDRIQFSVLEPLGAYCESLGVDIRLSSPATGLVVDGDAVKGVYWTDGSAEYEIDAPAVVLATGGFSSNKEMQEDLTKLPYERFHNWGLKGRDGDGITWAHEIGAELHIPSTMMGACTAVPEPTVFEEPLNWLFSWQPNLRVNQDGKRFFNEEVACDFCVSTNAILAQTQAFSLMDSAYVDMIANIALPFGMASVGYVGGEPYPNAPAVVAEGVADGRLIQADTLEELAEKAGFNAENFVAEMAAYNEMVASGGDDPVFGTHAASLAPFSTPPFYCAPIQPGCFTSVGGLRVDEWLRVIRESDGQPIAGLYALGGDASSDTGRDYDVGVMAGSQQGWCATGGRLVAEDLFAAAM